MRDDQYLLAYTPSDTPDSVTHNTLVDGPFDTYQDAWDVREELLTLHPTDYTALAICRIIDVRRAD